MITSSMTCPNDNVGQFKLLELMQVFLQVALVASKLQQPLRSNSVSTDTPLIPVNIVNSNHRMEWHFIIWSYV